MLDAQVHFTPENAQYIRSELARILASTGKKRLIEKTAANVMRIDFVHAVLPDAKIVHIVRDGRAVVASALIRWQAKPEAGYLMKKAGTIPLSRLPKMALEYGLNRIKGAVSGRGHTMSWGPVWPELASDMDVLPLVGVCAKQWQVSVKSAFASRIPAEQIMQIRYEDVVADPENVFNSIASFLDIDPTAPDFQQHICTQINDGSADKWREAFSSEELKIIYSVAGEVLQELGYVS
ncbi:sulfotransferase [Oleiphilus messinensis]|uniref:Sulfotransferase n=2 Tax=Oleiphilus messinensis TaxID=141451 RepID=A0A1Y0IJG1_9GAMM|nr:sulfotransferase [Oleiphilus messinensis]